MRWRGLGPTGLIDLAPGWVKRKADWRRVVDCREDSLLKALSPVVAIGCAFSEDDRRGGFRLRWRDGHFEDDRRPGWARWRD